MQHVPSKQWYLPTTLHDCTSEKTTVLTCVLAEMCLLLEDLFNIINSYETSDLF